MHEDFVPLSLSAFFICTADQSFKVTDFSSGSFAHSFPTRTTHKEKIRSCPDRPHKIGSVVKRCSYLGRRHRGQRRSSFPLGPLIQELGDTAIKTILGPRFFKQSRDQFWDTEEGHNVSAGIEMECGLKLPVDGAYDYCLTKIKGQFPRRDVFVATSDFCRSLLVVGILLIPAVARLVWDDLHGTLLHAGTYSTTIVMVLALYLYLSWRRMVRFRELSEVTVFRVYLACSNAADKSVEGQA